MAISLKSTVIFSGTLALLLNVWHFAASYRQQQDAFAPNWATASLTTTAAPTPIPTVTPAQTKSPPGLVPLTDTPPAPSPAPTAPVQPLPAPPITMNESLVQSELAASGLDPSFASLYLQVQSETNTPWELLAAVHKVETNQSGNTNRSSDAGATGPMQFLPATFDSYAAPGQDDITSVQDAMLAAGRYLAANGAASGDYQNALYHYNHSWDYVDRVMAIATSLGL